MLSTHNSNHTQGQGGAKPAPRTLAWLSHAETLGPALILLLGLAATAGAALWLRESAVQGARAEFERQVERVSDELSRRFLQPIYGLEGARVMYLDGAMANRARFESYVKSRDLVREFPGVRGFGFVQRVARAEQEAFAAQAGEADAAPFAIHEIERDRHEHLYVVRHIEPLANNPGVPGLNLGSEPLRRSAIEEAIERGQPIYSTALALVEDDRKSQGALLFVPVFSNGGAQPAAAQQRRDALVGLLYAPISFERLLDGVLSAVGGDVDFELREGAPTAPGEAAPGAALPPLAIVSGDPEPSRGGGFASEQTLTLPGLNLRLLAHSTSQFDAASASLVPWIVFAGGAAGSAMLAALLWQVGSGRRRAEALARGMTTQLSAALRESRDTERALARERLTLANVIEGTNVGTWEWNIEAGVLRVNERWAKMLGQSPDASGQIAVQHWIGCLDPDDAQRLAQQRARHFSGELPALECEVRARHGDGHWIWVQTAGKVFGRDAHGLPRWMAGTLRDVSARREAEQTALRATELAQQASQAKSQFLANMSHEIRTPMNAILGMLALLRRTELNVRQADYAAKTEGAARALLGVLNEILDFSKVEAGKMTLEAQPFRIDQLLRDLSVILSASVGAKPVEVLFDLDPALPRALLGDAMRLQQVLINLSGNAIKFTATGEVVVTIKVLECSAELVRVEFAVRDTGIGIAPENHARIFSGFAQAEASTTRRFGGTGLGVAISQRLVALMGGTLELDSALGRGSRFHFSIALPIAPESDQAAAGPAPPESPAGVPLRALVVDDNPVACEVLSRMGRSLGWTVDVAESGERALEMMPARAAEGISYQAVFVDWQMPGLDGWQTSQRIRALGLSGGAPVVVMVTAHGREMLAERSAAEQALLDGFLVKPVTASMLFDALVDARHANSGAHPSRPRATAASQRLQGLRLLVAEDNLNNQQVARELLEGEGARVQIANNGQEALQALAAAKPQFDLVLMDLQMPVLDGLAAARAIRRQPALAALPIVAMTANAMASDRAACLDAGMNDHVGKPFDLDHLVAVLRRHTGRGGELAAGVGSAASTLAPALRAAAESAGVDLDAALKRLGGKLAVYQRLLGGFVQELAGLARQLEQDRSSDDPQSLARRVHSLKGLAATLGALELSSVAGRAETQLAAQPEAGALDELLAGTCRAAQAAAPGLVALLCALEAAQAADAPAPTAAGHAADDAAAAREALRALAAQLRDTDMAATEGLAQLQRRFGATLGAPLLPIDAAVAALDFEHALLLCEELLANVPA